MQAIIKGSFSVSTSASIIVAMVLSGTLKKGDLIDCPMTDGTTRTFKVKAIETLTPSDPEGPSQYPIALIVEPFKVSEVAVGKDLVLIGHSTDHPETPSSAPIPPPLPGTLSGRKIS